MVETDVMTALEGCKVVKPELGMLVVGGDVTVMDVALGVLGTGTMLGTLLQDSQHMRW